MPDLTFLLPKGMLVHLLCSDFHKQLNDVGMTMVMINITKCFDY